MKRFFPTPRSKALSHKVKQSVDQYRYAAPGGGKLRLQVADVLGMDDESRSALERVLQVGRGGRYAVAGRFMPDRGVSELLARAGVVEDVADEDLGRFGRVLIPVSGVAAKRRRGWDLDEGMIQDYTAAKIRRAQVALGLLKMEGAQPLVIGQHEDAETLAICGAANGSLVIENTTDTARLLFSPSFGAVCQTTLSPKKVEWLVQQLRMRYQDARVSFLDTTNPSMKAREQALETLLVQCGQVVVVGEPGEASCEALAETAVRRGRAAVVVATPEDLDSSAFGAGECVAVTAGGYATDEAVIAVTEALARR